jgi:hypothetical protein
MNPYNNCILYIIKCKNLNILDCYIGHTTNWTKREEKHKYNSIWLNTKLYRFIREHGGWDNFEMLGIELYPCNNKRQAEAKEEQLIKQHKASLNTYENLVLTEEQLKEYMKDYLATYRAFHRDELYAKKAINVKCEACNKEYRKYNLKNHKCKA